MAASVQNSVIPPSERPALSEAVLESFTRATQVKPFDDRLFDLAGSGDLAQRLVDLVTAVKGADADALMRRQGFRHALLGADVEARLKFAVARQAAQKALGDAEAAAALTAERIGLLETVQPKIEAEDRRLAAVAAKAEALAEAFAPPATREAKDLRDRFDRRRANLSALRASNTLALAQIPPTIAGLRALLDRFVDVKATLFPVWERHALGLIQAPRDPEPLKGLKAAVAVLADRLEGVA